MSLKPKFKYYNNCVNWPKNDIDHLCGMIEDSIEITRKAFTKNVDKYDLK